MRVTLNRVDHFGASYVFATHAGNVLSTHSQVDGGAGNTKFRTIYPVMCPNNYTKSLFNFNSVSTKHNFWVAFKSDNPAGTLCVSYLFIFFIKHVETLFKSSRGIYYNITVLHFTWESGLSTHNTMNGLLFDIKLSMRK